MAFIVNPTEDPVLRRGERMGRYGSLIPFLGVCVLSIAGGLARMITGETLTRPQYADAIGALVVVGQVVVWLGMHYLRRCLGWNSGISFYLWAGGFFTSLAICYTTVFPLALIPWVAPIVASLARRRMVKGGRG
jgi:hypothetical protein